jgi:hypothetical protein
MRYPSFKLTYRSMIFQTVVYVVLITSARDSFLYKVAAIEPYSCLVKTWPPIEYGQRD